MIEREKFEAMGGGSDSSFDSEEMYPEMRDKVKGQMKLIEKD